MQSPDLQRISHIRDYCVEIEETVLLDFCNKTLKDE